MPKSEDKLRKKQLKQQHKLEKKKLEAASTEPRTEQSPSPSLYVRFADSIKGILYIILAISMFAAVILGESGLIITLEDIIDSLIIARLGKVLIAIIAVALFIYGLKNLRFLK